MPVSRSDASSLGVMRSDAEGRITGFLEKPKTDEELNSMEIDASFFEERGVPANGRGFLASMGIYVFHRDVLLELLERTEYRDFGKEIFPASIRARRVVAHLFDDYWEDIGTIRAFYEANLSLAQENAPFDFVSEKWPVFTRARFLPPSRIDGATVESSMVAEGCRIGHGAKIKNSVIGLRCIIGAGVDIRDSVIMGADYYSDKPGSGPRIGDNATIANCILDKNCEIGAGAKLINEKNIENSDMNHPLCVIRDGIPVVVKDAKIPEGWNLTDEMKPVEG